ncbi:MAG: hypothetical protein GX846_06865 [Deltaproteobacteria bacterium]|nr:hypothetical protein [Deltaproteobacteria bacterium]
MMEASEIIRSGGRKISWLHFSQVWPLYPDNFLKYLEAAKMVISVEGNATGQFARLIRMETGFHIHKQVLRYDGLPITPDFIINRAKI